MLANEVRQNGAFSTRAKNTKKNRLLETSKSCGAGVTRVTDMFDCCSLLVGIRYLRLHATWNAHPHGAVDPGAIVGGHCMFSSGLAIIDNWAAISCEERILWRHAIGILQGPNADFVKPAISSGKGRREEGKDGGLAGG